MTRMRRAATAALAAMVAMTTAAPSALATAPRAQAARTINITEHVDLHLVRKSGNTLYQSGTATGTLPGNVSAIFKVEIARVSGTVTIYPRGGSLTISVNGTPRSAGSRPRFAGSMKVLRGTGRYKHASGSGTFSGSVSRRTWAARVDANARLTY